MQIDPAYRIEDVAEHDGPTSQSGPVIGYVNITTYRDEPVAIAADGYCLAVVPVTLEDGDVEGLVHWTVFQRARQMARKGWPLKLYLGAETVGFEDGWTAPRILHRDLKDYPEWPRILPDLTQMPDAWPVWALNPRLLAKVAGALGNEHCMLHKCEGGLNPQGILVATTFQGKTAPEPPFGVLMPLHHSSMPDAKYWEKRRAERAKPAKKVPAGVA